MPSKLLLAACVVLAGFRAAPEVAPAGSAADRGHRLFDVHCARCHGIGGGGGEGPPLNRPVLRRAPDDDAMVSVIRDGIPRTAMTGLRALSADEARLVVAYVRSLGRVAEEPLSGDADRGRSIYDDQACAACHIVAGEGRGIGPELTAVGTTRGAAYLRQSVVDADAVVSDDYRLLEVRAADGIPIRGVRVYEDEFSIVLRDANGELRSYATADLQSLRRVMGGSLMPSYGGRLSPDEVEDLVAYLAGLRGGE